MNRFWTLGALTVALAGVAAADEWDKKTNITVNETILIPGKQLPPGKYVMKLANITANRHVVQIYNEKQDHLEATIMAFNNQMIEPDPKGNTVLTYWETPAGSPPALRAWFFPGDTWGQEFAYPKAMAEKLAALNHTKVASYDEASLKGAPTPDNLKTIDVPVGEEATSSTTTVAQNTPPPAPAPRSDINAAPERSTNNDLNNNDNLVAQNDTRPPQLVAQAQTTPPAPAPSTTSTLPQTASYLPLIIAVGMALTAFGALLGFRHA
jgi:hypothetical protein